MLKLVLQTQEGQQIEVTVSQDDTFADLQRQYESPENPGLPELLRHLITNGTDVDQRTKVFDYVTNSSKFYLRITPYSKESLPFNLFTGYFFPQVLRNGWLKNLWII